MDNTGNVGLNRIKRFDFTDILGWSVSRYDKFVLCKRQYYFDYYGKYDTEFPRAKINALKQLTSIPLETGNVVHDTVKVLLERLLKTEAPIEKSRFMEFVRRKTDAYCAEKKFAEVYYGEQQAVDPSRVHAGVERCMTNFLESDRFKWIVQQAVHNKTGWVIEPPGFGETRIDGFKAYCKVDFLFPVDGTIYILDWKTGKQDGIKHRKQLIGYSTWASYHFSQDPALIVPTVVYLTPQYSELSIKVNEFDLQEFTTAVAAETREMYAYCADVERNLPKPKEAFQKTPRTAVCRFCNYREICK
jgi:hypothetical protein